MFGPHLSHDQALEPARQCHQYDKDHSNQADILYRRYDEGDLNLPTRLLAVRDWHGIGDDRDASDIGDQEDQAEQQQRFEKNTRAAFQDYKRLTEATR